MKWICQECNKEKHHEPGWRIGCAKADCPAGILLLSMAHDPGQIEQVVSGLLKRPVLVQGTDE